MPTKPTPETDLSSFASRRAEREAREAIEGPTPRRQVVNRADYSGDFTTSDGVRIRRVQA